MYVYKLCKPVVFGLWRPDYNWMGPVVDDVEGAQSMASNSMVSATVGTWEPAPPDMW